MKRLAALIRDLWLGLVLVLLACGLLLLSDLNRREGLRKTSATKVPRLALLQWSSTALLDDTVTGLVEGLRQQGYEEGQTLSLRLFNAQGDHATASVMAREMVEGGYDLLLTASTPALQTLAKANQERKIPHLFAAVTDPFHAGVGITGESPDQRPHHLMGVGTFQPVEELFRLARQMNPALKAVGVVWNPAEDNSEACLKKARTVCSELGISLLESQASLPAEVPQAVASLLTRGAQALWVGGDTVAIAALGTILKACAPLRVPVMTNDPQDTAAGALFALGASYRQVGMEVGRLAGGLLAGGDLSGRGVTNRVPEVLSLREDLLGLYEGWGFSDAIRERAARTRQTLEPPGALASDRTFRVVVLAYGPDKVFEDTTRGIRQAFRDRGLVEGSHLNLDVKHAQNDATILAQLVRQVVQDKPDLLMPLSTPCLAASLGAGGEMPLVFAAVTAPLQAGAGQSFVRHHPRVTGAVWAAPAAAAFPWLRRLFPSARRVGVLSNPAHANTGPKLEKLRQGLKDQGLGLEERTLATAAEMPEALASLLGAQAPDLIFGLGDNTVVSAFPALAATCRRQKIPLIAEDASLMGQGALFSVGPGPEAEGYRAGLLAVRVLGGEAPAGIPFSTGDRMQVAVDFGAARELGLTFPQDLLAQGDLFLNLRERLGRPLKVVVVNLVHSPTLDRARKGLEEGLSLAGLRLGEDVLLRDLNAQGEPAQVPLLLQAAREGRPDLIVPLTTPVFITAARPVRDIPLVFAVASDPAALGLFTPDARPPNMTGVHDDPPVDRLLELALGRLPLLRAVGVVYDPAQPNALISVEKLRVACREHALPLHEATAAGLSDLSPATRSVIQKGAGVLILSADNLVCSGFAAIHQVARAEGIPIYVTDVELVAQGASLAYGDDFGAWGRQAGLMAARVLAGVAPGTLPVECTRGQTLRETVQTQARGGGRSGKPWKVRVVRYTDVQYALNTQQGIGEGFAQAGWKEGVDLDLKAFSAQGDMSTLSSILTAVVAEEPDLIMPISTPALQASLRQAGDLPIIFSSVADGVGAGAGERVDRHLPHVTGITTRAAFDGMTRIIAGSFPGIQRVGTLFSPSEINSELYRKWFADALAVHGIELVAVPVTSSSETAEATGALLRTGVPLIAQIADNTTRPGYPQIIRRAFDAGVPFFCFDSAGMKDGACLALARDYIHTGREATQVAIRFLERGEDLAQIPFTNTQTEVLVGNFERLQHFGIRLTEQIRAKITPYVEQRDEH